MTSFCIRFFESGVSWIERTESRKYCDRDEDEIEADGDKSGREQLLWLMQ